MMRDWEEEFGQLIDKLDNLANALQLPMRAELHVKALRESLPETVTAFKEIYEGMTGKNPWA